MRRPILQSNCMGHALTRSCTGRQMQVETVEQYLQRGGKITVCPGFGGGASFLHHGVVQSVRCSPSAGWIAIVRDSNGHKAQLAATNWHPPGLPKPKAGDAVRFDTAINGRGVRYCTIARPEETESAA